MQNTLASFSDCLLNFLDCEGDELTKAESDFIEKVLPTLSEQETQDFADSADIYGKQRIEGREEEILLLYNEKIKPLFTSFYPYY
jgi:hypothetical protein